MLDTTNTTIEITEGSTSTGSTRPVDIINGIRFLSDSDDKLKELIAEFDDTADGIEFDISESDFIYEDIFDRLNEIAPDGLTFGSHLNDGADFGFWSSDDGFEDGEFEDTPGSFGYPITTPEA